MRANLHDDINLVSIATLVLIYYLFSGHLPENATFKNAVSLMSYYVYQLCHTAIFPVAWIQK